MDKGVCVQFKTYTGVCLTLIKKTVWEIKAWVHPHNQRFYTYPTPPFQSM